MVLAQKIGILLLGCSVLGAQTPDPVMKARAERAQAQGIGEGDLPPLPRGITEPPPLPPPEIHVKDTRAGAKAAKSRSRGKAASRATKTAKSSKHPAKGGRKSSKRVKV
jgi:hypothetical protein